MLFMYMTHSYIHIIHIIETKQNPNVMVSALFKIRLIRKTTNTHTHIPTHTQSQTKQYVTFGGVRCTIKRTYPIHHTNPLLVPNTFLELHRNAFSV